MQINRKSLTVFIFIFIINLIPAVEASEGDLFTYISDFESSQKEAQPGVYKIQLADNLLSAVLGSQLKLKLEGLQEYTLVHDRKTRHANGDITWFGYLKDHGRGYRISITLGRDLIQGRIITPDGLYIITTKGNDTFLEDVVKEGLISGATGPDDYLIPDVLDQSKRKSAPRVAALVGSTENVTIDLMILYNQDMAAKYPGTALQTKINQLVALANQAYVDSKIYITLKLVHTAQINYSNTIQNSTALSAMTDGDGVFSSVASLRTQYGADLVSFIRPFDNTHHKGCGIAWLNGLNNSDISGNADTGYSVISEGQDSPYYCDDTTLAHELGHNMGNEHDRDHATSQGAYSYSYGHDKSGVGEFATIMSYDAGGLNYFSNPDISECNGYPCGVEAGQPNSANNALSMNNTRAAIAAFMDNNTDVLSTTESDCLFNWGEDNYPSLFTPSRPISQTSNPYYYRYYTVSNTYLGYSSADDHLYFLGPDGILLDLGLAATWSTTAGCR